MSHSPGFQPLGRIPQSSGGRPNFRIAVLAFVALHAVFFAGLLLQGCRPKTEVAEAPPPTNGLPDINALFGEWTNNTTRAEEPPDIGFQPPPATNEPVAIDVPPGGRTPDGTGAPTNHLSGGQTAGQRLVEEDQGAREPGPNEGRGAGQAQDATADLAQARQHVVETGDTFWSLSQKYGVTVRDIAEANPGVLPEKLKPRQTLVIPPPKPKTAALEESYDGQIHVVKRGDTLIGLSEKYGVTVKALRDANSLRTDVIKVDQKLKIPPPQGN